MTVSILHSQAIHRFYQIPSYFLVLLSAGCSMAPAIETSSLAYEDTIEGVTNKSLVVNILRARDGAPLYLTDLAQIRGGLSTSASTQAMIPYGPTFGSVQAGAFSAGSTPTFDINPGNTKRFYEGIMNPISKQVFEFYIARLRFSKNFSSLLYLLSAGVSETRGGLRKSYGYNDSEFFQVTDPWLEDKFPPRLVKNQPVVKQQKELQIEPSFVDLDAKSVVEATSAGLKIVKRSDNRFHIEAKPTDDTVICVHAREGYVPLDLVQNSTVKTPVGEDFSKGRVSNACSALNPKGASGPDKNYTLYLRSVEQIFYYLGFSLRSDFAMDPDNSRSIYSQDGCRRLSFYISDHLVNNVHFSAQYRGKTYYVRDNVEVRCPNSPNDSQYDYTLQTLATLNELLNLNRDADEVSTTKAVQAVGPR